MSGIKKVDRGGGVLSIQKKHVLARRTAPVFLFSPTANSPSLGEALSTERSPPSLEDTPDFWLNQASGHHVAQ